MNGATNTYYPNNKTSDATLTGADQPAYLDLITLDATLQDQGARPYEGGEYCFVCPSQVFASLLKDPDFKASNQFQRPDRIWRGEVASLGGFRVIRTNAPSFAVTTSAVAGVSTKVYSSFALGRFAYKITDLQNLRVYVVAPGGQLDPLQQSRKIGWKFAFKSLIVNQNWIRRVRSSGANSTTN